MPKSPDDPCGRCGCKRCYHRPPKTTENAGQWAHRIGATDVTVDIPARSCCWGCPHCFCFCIAFVEPYPGQSFIRCSYEAEDYTHRNPTTVPYHISISSRVSPVQADSVPPDDPGDAEPLPTGSQVPSKHRKKKGARAKTTYKRGSETTQLRWEP